MGGGRKGICMLVLTAYAYADCSWGYLWLADGCMDACRGAITRKLIVAYIIKTDMGMRSKLWRLPYLHSLPVSPITTTHSARRTHQAPFCLGCEGHVHGVSPNTLRYKAYISVLYLELYKLSNQRSSPAQTVLDSHNLSPSSDHSHTITPRPRPPTGKLENGSRQFLPVQSPLRGVRECLSHCPTCLTHMSHSHVSLGSRADTHARHSAARGAPHRSGRISPNPQSPITVAFSTARLRVTLAARGTESLHRGRPLSGPSKNRHLSKNPLLLAIRWNKVRHKVSVYIEPSPPHGSRTWIEG